MNRGGISETIKLGLLCVAFLFSVPGAHADNTTSSPKDIEFGPLIYKMDTNLIPTINRLRAHKDSAAHLTLELQAKCGATLAQSSGAGLFVVRLDCAVTLDLIKQISATGAAITSQASQWNTVMVEATLNQISALADIPGIKYIKLQIKATTRQAGAADNHADIDMKADQLRTALGVTGSGVKIGVLSDSCNRSGLIGTGTTSGTIPNAFLSNLSNQNTGDLPSPIQVVDFGSGSDTDEGSGMMEVIHDIATSSPLVFSSAATGETSFALNIIKLKDVGCKIIVDDVFYFDEPNFQDGPIAQAADTVADAGVSYFTATGNDADKGVLAVYKDGVTTASDQAYPPTGVNFHDWGIGGPTPTFLPVFIPENSFYDVYLQWNEPWQSYGLGPGAQADYDLYLYAHPTTTSTIIGSSRVRQGTMGSPSGDPVEGINYDNTDNSGGVAYLAIDHYAGATTATLRVLFFANGRDYEFPGGGVNSPTVVGHGAAKGAISVAASFYGDIASGGLDLPDTTDINPEDFSSKGGYGALGIPIYRDTSGTLIANGPELRNKPDIIAPDGVNTSFFGFDVSDYLDGIYYDDDFLPNFFGTSCAAPNAAAVAALLLEKNPSLTPIQMKKLLQSTAHDMVCSAPLCTAGPDDQSGFGLINALKAGYAALKPSLDDQFLTGTTGWSQFGTTTAEQSTSYNAPNTALAAHITSSNNGYRIIGWLSDASNTLNYAGVGTDGFVRAKYYIYASGQTSAALNQIPNFRIRVANRFAVNSILQVYNHLDADPEATNLSADIRPSTNPASPSLYRVDLDPIDVPQLTSNSLSEGFLRLFEAYEPDPQANGNVAMTECILSAYPALPDFATTVPVTQNGLIKSYRPSATGGGDFGTGNSSVSNSQISIAKYFDGALETTGPQPSVTINSAGVTLETLSVQSDRFAAAAFDVFNDIADQTNHLTRARVEPGKQYKVRFHATATKNSTTQSVMRFRARTIKFQYTASMEVGGSQAASVANNTLAAQALPGIGNQIPISDRINPSENGGWYNVLMVTPMNSDIQTSQSNLAAQDPPGVDTHPASNAKSRRDLQFGFDVIDTFSTSPNAGLESGEMTVDQVDIEKYDLVPD